MTKKHQEDIETTLTDAETTPGLHGQPDREAPPETEASLDAEDPADEDSQIRLEDQDEPREQDDSDAQPDSQAPADSEREPDSHSAPDAQAQPYAECCADINRQAEPDAANDPEDPDDDSAPIELLAPDEEFEPTVESVIEAVLFASDEPLSPARLAGIVETGIKQVKQHIANLNHKYRATNNAFRIEAIAGGYQMLTLGPYNHWLKKLLRVRSDSKLSPAALETLAIIAYKQPVIRADIEAIRGVAGGEVIRSLMYKGLVKIVGRAEVLGRPMLYGTTKKFLEVFGLNSLKDLPKVEELKAPSP